MADVFSKLNDQSTGEPWKWKVIRTPDPSTGGDPATYAVVSAETIADRLVNLLNADEV